MSIPESAPGFPAYDRGAYRDAVIEVVLTGKEMHALICRAITIATDCIGPNDNRYPYLADGFAMAVDRLNTTLENESEPAESYIAFGKIATHTTMGMMAKHGSERGTLPPKKTNAEHEIAFWNDEAIDLVRAALLHALPKPAAEA